MSIILKPKLSLLSILVMLVLLVFTILLPNLGLVSVTILNPQLSLVEKINILESLLEGFQTNYTNFSRTILITSAVLAGIQLSLLTHLVQQKIHIYRSMGISGFGLITSLISISCISCGSVLLSTLIGFGSTITLLTVLPYHGEEIGPIGIAIQLFSLLIVIREIKKLNNCQCKSVG